MNKAIAYIRISDKDQSNFSLEGQEKYIRKHCESNDIELLEVFIDDGRSAKNFDRPDWKKLETFIQQHHRQVNYLVVVKYDRFSRNAAQGLQKIELLERKFKIVIMSVFEQMFIDFDSPFYFKQRADMLVNAEFELHVIRDRTKFGIHQATSSGRFVSTAPVGYINARDEKNKPIITINEAKAVFIRLIFEMYLAGHSFATIARECRLRGLKVNGRTGIPYILQNPVYAGMVKVNAYRKEPAKIVTGIHEPIISNDVFYTVQKKLAAKINPKFQAAEEVPLRTVVEHTCGKKLTAGKSKGRRNHYWYYKCNVCPKTNFSAITAHKKFDDILHALSFNEAQVQYMITEGEKQLAAELAERDNNLVTFKKQHTETVQSLEMLEEKYINNQVQADTYNRFYYKYSAEIARLQSQIIQLNSNHKNKWEQYRTGLIRLQNLKWIWDNASLIQKHEFIRLVFNSSLQYDGQIYRTPYLISLFSHNILEMKEKNLLHVTETGFENVKKITSAPDHTSIEPVTAFISLINSIKVA